MMAAFAGCGLPGFANFAAKSPSSSAPGRLFPLVTIFACWRLDHWRGLYAASGPRDIARAVAGTMGQRGRRAHLWRKARSSCCSPASWFRLLPRLLTDKIQRASARSRRWFRS